MGKATKIFRLFRGTEPEPGDAGTAAHVGDFPSMAAAQRAQREFPGETMWVEPITWNGDVEAPEYANAGRIVRLDPD